MKLKRGLQKYIRNQTGFAAGYVSDICNCRTRIDSWSTAKTFASATNSNPLLWLEGTCDDIQTMLNNLDLKNLKNAA